MNQSDLSISLLLFATLTALSLVFVYGIRLMHSRRLATFRRMHPQEDIDDLRRSWAQLETLLAILADLGEAISIFTSERRSEQDLQSALTFVLESACQGLVLEKSYCRGRFLVWESSSGMLVSFAVFSAEGVPQFGGTRFAAGYGTPGQAFSSGQVIVVDDFTQAFPDEHDAWNRPYKSVVCVPVPTVPEPSMRVGVLNFDSDAEGYFTEEHVQFLRGISSLVYTAYRHVYGS